MTKKRTPTSRKTSPTVFGYRTYSFVDKDPVIDVVRTILQRERLDLNEVARAAGVHPTTVCAWLYGITRSPRFATVAAICAAMGYSVQPTRQSSQPALQLVSKKKIS